MNERIRQLREHGIRTHPYISAERAQLATEFQQSDRAQGVSVPMRRALSFAYILKYLVPISEQFVSQVKLIVFH